MKVIFILIALLYSGKCLHSIYYVIKINNSNFNWIFIYFNIIYIFLHCMNVLPENVLDVSSILTNLQKIAANSDTSSLFGTLFI